MVTIIIPTFKSWDLLEKCLEAISLQTYLGSYEVIVVNNDTDNNIPENLKKYKNVSFLQELKPGSYAARNKGLQYADGDIVAFTDADCIPQKNWLENGVNTLLKTNAGIVGGRIKLFYRNPHRKTAAEIYDSYTAFNQEGYVKQGNCVTANWFSFKSVVLEFGGFNSNLKSNGDSELSAKISKKYPVVYSENTLILHPARHEVQEIITKYRRVMGGTYDRVYRDSNMNFKVYLYNFMYRRLKFNFNIFLKLKIFDSMKIFYIHTRLFPALIREYYLIRKTGQTERL